ncbi:MAG: CPBP family intramembrane metalloprotease [Planctomycetales bacterium]|nr:CPBP family intramembrane metalloprotease [Planctomycetales bacterium]
MSLDAMLVFEFGLGVAALLIGWFFDFDPLRTIPRGTAVLSTNLKHIALGAALALPLLVFFLTLEVSLPELFRPIRDALDEALAPTLCEAGWAGRALVSLGAGIGEELLFRGLIQDGLGQLWGSPLLALLAASVLFGAVHWLNTTYFLFATGMGLVFGALWIWTGSLVAPIVMHAVYDMLALESLMRDYNRRKQGQ